MIAYVVDNNIIDGPMVAPTVWKDPNGNSYSAFSDKSIEEMFALGWKEVVDEPPVYNSMFDEQVIGDWYYTTSGTATVGAISEGVVTRDYTTSLVDFTTALTNAATVAKANRDTYGMANFALDFQISGMDLIVTTNESAQSELSAAYVKAQNGTRLDTDVWSFYTLTGDIIIIPVSNTDISLLADFVFRKIQDSYNLMSQIFWQLLATGDTETAKEQVENGTINLNPWGV